jgi:acyl-ACP thioesterase
MNTEEKTTATTTPTTPTPNTSTPATKTHLADRVKFYDCDTFGKYKPSSMLKAASEVAGHDYNIKGLPYQFLLEHKLAFLVSRVSFLIHRYPKDQEKLDLYTWENGKQRTLFIRGFEIFSGGEKLVEAAVGWLLVNPFERKIIKPRDCPFPQPQLDEVFACKPIGKIQPQDLQHIGNRTIRYSDLDENGHVYNANYADIAMDFLPLDTLKKQIKNFRINFNREAKFGDNLELFGDFSDDANVVIGKLDGQVCFEAEFVMGNDD